MQTENGITENGITENGIVDELTSTITNQTKVWY